MEDVDAFMTSTMPRLTAADTALHNGDARPRMIMWSHKDPVTLFGAARSGKGWDEIGPLFDWLGTRFSHCTSFEYEVVAAGVSGDLAYIVGIEHTTASIAGSEPRAYALRVTQIFRREDGEWKVVHRHADPHEPTAEKVAATLTQ
jgi:ketosteroid isomerase-like protein